MNIDADLQRLNTLLPLLERKKKLTKKCRETHSNILNAFAQTTLVENDYDPELLDMLAAQDLIVFDKDNKIISGAYPFSQKETPHQIYINNEKIYAMCAFDAVAISPVFNIKTKIISNCYLTQEKVVIKQSGNQLEKVTPTADVHIGIRWQTPGSCAAQSLCMEMVFLLDNKVANQWRDNNADKDIYCLDEAIAFATSYFKPLVSE